MGFGDWRRKRVVCKQRGKKKKVRFLKGLSFHSLDSSLSVH